MNQFKQLIPKEKIDKRIQEMGQEIRSSYGDYPISVLCVLTGSFIFCSDLVREVGGPLEIEFIRASSYGDSTESSRDVKVWGLDGLNLTNKNVLIVEDIVDTGHTVAALMPMLEKAGAKSLKLASLLYKPSRNEVKVDIDFLGFEIEDHFVIGYGLDLGGRFREIPEIVIYEPEK